MSLSKPNLINAIHQNSGLSKTKSAEFLEEILEMIKKSLESGEDVLISGFGKFYLTNKNMRKGRNPATGEDLMLGARRIVAFKSSIKLKDRVND